MADRRNRTEWGLTLRVLTLAAAVVSGVLLVPAPAFATVTVSRGEVDAGRLRIEGRATANRSITVDGVAMATSDGSGSFRVSRSPYTPPADCTVDVNDGSATATPVRLSGCTVTSAPPPPATSATLSPDAAELAAGYVGAEYASLSNIVSIGPDAVGPVRWDVVSGALPAGLAIVVPVPAGRPSPTEPTYMNIEGIPTTVQTSTFTLRAVDAEGRTATRTYTIRINPARALAITPQSANPLRVGSFSNLWYDASGGVQPYRWEVTAGALPPGMQLVDDTPGDALVRVGGTPSASGTFTWTLRLSDAQGLAVDRAVTVTVAPASLLTSVTLDPDTVTGGTPATGTVTLASPAPPEGAEVTVSSSAPASATTQTRLFVLAAETSATFPISTTAVGTRTTVTITATYAGDSRSATLTLDPPAGTSPAEVSAVTLTPSTVTGGGGSTGTVRLAAPAPSEGVVIGLASSTGAAVVPADVAVPAGATTATFPVSTTAVTSATTVTITATHGSSSASTVLSISPATSSQPLVAPSLLSPANDARWAPGASRTFDWSDVAGGSSYLLQVSASSAFTTVQLERVVTASQVALSFATEGTRYWRVRARDSAGTAGPWSTSRFFRIRS